jgi:hypothetical protein
VITAIKCAASGLGISVRSGNKFAKMIICQSSGAMLTPPLGADPIYLMISTEGVEDPKRSDLRSSWLASI